MAPNSSRWLMGRSLLLAVLGLPLVVGVVVLVGIKLLYGLGTPYPDSGGAPLMRSSEVTEVAALDFPPGNVTGSRDGRIFFNTHPLVLSQRFTNAYLFELVEGKPRPYPDLASQADLRFVFGMTVDAHNVLWLTAPATLDRKRTRLVAFDLATNKRLVDRELAPGVAKFGQDLRVAPDGKTILFANPGAFRFTKSTLVVLDTTTWRSRDLLGDSPAIRARDWLIRTYRGPYRVAFGLLSFQVGLDGIVIDRDGHWLYMAAMTHDSLYRVPLRDVLNPTMTPADLVTRVEPVGRKPLSDGIDATPDGRVLITDVEHGGISSLGANGELKSLIRLPRVTWADGVYAAPNGDVYFTDSAIPTYIDPLLRPPGLSRLRSGRPYHLYRFRLPALHEEEIQ